jgi:serine/threonine protein kinase
MGEVRLGGRFRLHSKIASGSFGDCYLGSDITTRQELAIKLEPCKSQHPQLEYEYKIYRQLENGPGIPHVYWFGREGKHRALVMDLLGHSLEELMNAAGKFTTQTTCSLARQLLTRLEYIHSMVCLILSSTNQPPQGHL